MTQKQTKPIRTKRKTIKTRKHKWEDNACMDIVRKNISIWTSAWCNDYRRPGFKSWTGLCAFYIELMTFRIV